MFSHTSNRQLLKCIDGTPSSFDPKNKHVIGVLIGEGVGSEVVSVALSLLEILKLHTQREFKLETGGLIGYPAKEKYGSSLSSEIIDFSESIFLQKGALFCGPGGERFVYEMRRQFELYCKFTPIEPLPELIESGAIRPNQVRNTDIIMVRENMAGIYQGEWSKAITNEGEVVASQNFAYTQSQIMQILKVAFKLAHKRRQRLHVVLKPGGIPSISELWWECAQQMQAEFSDVALFQHEIDNAVYQLIANPSQFDVVVSPNLFGDVLADCASLLLASRGLSYSGNFNSAGNGVYQTGHGAARDIAGKDIANPIGQIFSLGMLLRESFHWPEGDNALRQAVKTTLQRGIYTSDIAPAGCGTYGTREFGEQVGHSLRQQLQGLTL
ncbi:isocitrate/isopropylmalate family dehydrogenase [Polynucleobacter sp. JS-JIR-II-b4]|uniref:isocitrate/isopropylmalate family dehydrogenase n=1 Tax=Polynucleobacter sp. JS-JIR-II-b4 TaxID=1758390 RepID=UPI001BFEAEA9|nr:isocitrate/isopropylmalate family dehydrogenase [Polynucleobacter sp. JS-JIR-II-b4]QWE02868.1 3-isopropylmalate dehydrogenase [Polynucleobacter sp. JS-JIR-II-b4]